MSYRATRGVCIGVGRHIAAGDPAPDLDPATVQFLVSIGALEKVEAPAKDEAKPKSSAPAAAGSKEK